MWKVINNLNFNLYKGMLRSVQSKDYIKFSLAAIEKGIQLCHERAKQVNCFFLNLLI